MTENLIYQHKLIEIEPDHDKLSYLYHIDVYQALVSKDAYKYLSNLQKNISQTGSLFAPLPAEYKGNVKCATSPEQPVIGYVDVATITHKSYIYQLAMSYMSSKHPVVLLFRLLRSRIFQRLMRADLIF